MILSIGNRPTIRLFLWLAILIFGFIPVHAQELVKSSAKPPSDPPETNVAERVRLLESELERQNSKLDQLQKTLTEQQHTIQALLDKLSGQTGSPEVATKESETASTITESTAPAEPQAPSVEQRLAQVEG